MKRTLAIILAVVLCFQFFGMEAVAAGAGISLSSAEGLPGKRISVNVTITGNTGLAYLKIKVAYDSSALTLISAVNTGLLGGTFTTSKTTDVNPYVLQWMAAENSVGDGVIATLTFEISETAEAGNQTISLTVEECYDEEFNDVVLTPSDGIVTVTIPDCPHTTKTGVPAKSADCVNSGNNLYFVCDSCDVAFKADGFTETTIEAETIPALGHDLSAATCTEAAKCQRDGCGYVEGSALGHSFTNYVSNGDATCEADGTKTAKCDRCDATNTVVDEGSAKGHDYADATCTAPKTCKVCGATEGEALDHHYATAWSKGEDGHWHECYACGDKIDFAIHDFGSEGGTCRICEYERAHVHGLTLVPGVDATCTKGGRKAYYTCSGCEDWFEDASGTVIISDKTSVIIAALGHDMSEVTCTEAARCQREGCDYTEGSAPGHIDANADIKCDRCGIALESDQPTTPNKPADDVPQTGDNSNTMLWATFLMLSFAGIVVCVLLSRKREIA